jgi:hypothetical protein
MIYCVQPATGTDGAVNRAIAGLPQTILADQGLAAVAQTLQAVPGLLAAIDEARADPDDLYLTAGTVGDVDRAIWPGPGQTMPLRAGQTVAPGVTLAFAGSQNISLWDYDGVSRDDLLGSFTIFDHEIGQELFKLAASTVEGSIYYVHYRVY